MNKKGDIPVTILVIGVVFLCGLALFSFYNSNVKVRNSFVGIKLIERINSQIEQNSFDGKSSNGLKLQKTVSDSILFWKQTKVIFSVEYKFSP